MGNLVTGQCLCGAVKFRISGEFEGFFLCHCGRCRKDSGSAHSANLFSSTAKIAWLSGEQNIKTAQQDHRQQAEGDDHQRRHRCLCRRSSEASR
jgi:hypothetical protein